MQHTATHSRTPNHTATHLISKFKAPFVFARVCNTLQHTATHCRTLQHPATPWNTLQHTSFPSSRRLLSSSAKPPAADTHTATHSNTQPLTATHLISELNAPVVFACKASSSWHSHCNTLQHTATHCNTLQHTSFPSSMRLLSSSVKPLAAETHTATHCNTLQHTATRCNTLQHTATHCNTLHHTSFPSSMRLLSSPVKPPAADTRHAAFRLELALSCVCVRDSMCISRQHLPYCLPFGACSVLCVWERDHVCISRQQSPCCLPCGACIVLCVCVIACISADNTRHAAFRREVGGWGRVPFSRNLMSPTPRRKWYLTTGRRFH